MKYVTRILPLLLIMFVACSGESENDSANGSTASSANGGLTDFEMEHGIGPVSERIDIGDFDPSLAEKGQNIFNSKCAACHEPNNRFVGPAYADVLERRSPEFVMNIILNPGEMVRQHPEGQKMLAEYMTAMPFQNVSRDEARAIVEYFRTYQE